MRKRFAKHHSHHNRNEETWFVEWCLLVYNVYYVLCHTFLSLLCPRESAEFNESRHPPRGIRGKKHSCKLSTKEHGGRSIHQDTSCAVLARSSLLLVSLTVVEELFTHLPSALPNSPQDPFFQKKRKAASRQPIELAASQSAPDVTFSRDFQENSVMRESTDPRAPRQFWKSTTAPPKASQGFSSYPGPAFGHTLDEQPFSLISPNNVDIKMPNTVPDCVDSNTAVTAFSTQPDSPFAQTCQNRGFSDLSAMMFPSSDPFAYPNQLMMTLEDNQVNQQEQIYYPPMYDTGSSLTVNGRGKSSNLSDSPFTPFTLPGQLPESVAQDSSIPGGVGVIQVSKRPMVNTSNGVWDLQQGPFGPPAPPPEHTNWNQAFGEGWSCGWTDRGQPR